LTVTFKAASTSAIISLIFSIPTDNLINPPVIPNYSLTSLGTDPWVITAGNSAKLSTPPKDSASVKIFKFFKKVFPSSKSPLI